MNRALPIPDLTTLPPALEAYAETLSANWWWIHFILLGIGLGGSLGIWAYRDLWYAASTFLSAPIPTSSLWKAARQWLASLLLFVPAAVTVAVILTTPEVFSRLTEELQQLLAVGGSLLIWFLLRLFTVYTRAYESSSATLFRSPFRWARYRASQSPDTLVSRWSDFFLGLALHGGLAILWAELYITQQAYGWIYLAALAGSFAWILTLTAISVLLQPPAVSHD